MPFVRLSDSTSFSKIVILLFEAYRGSATIPSLNSQMVNFQPNVGKIAGSLRCCGVAGTFEQKLISSLVTGGTF